MTNSGGGTPVAPMIGDESEPSGSSGAANDADLASGDEEQGRLKPWTKQYKPSRHVFTSPSVRDFAYTFLMRQNRTQLRDIAKTADVRQNGVKNAVVCHLMRFADLKAGQSDAVYKDIFGTTQVAFWRIPGNIQDVFKAPCAEDISLQDKTAPPKSITVPEFARLIAVLTESDKCRSALLQSGLNLNRDDLQRGDGRDAFWTTVVEPLFNDETAKFAMDLRGSVQPDDGIGIIDVNQSPQCHRNGVWLKDEFASIRSLFTKAYHNFSVSGQNDGEASQFCNFVPRAPGSTQIARKSKLLCILFYALRCGTPEEDTDILNFTMKLAPHEMGYDDGEQCGSSMRGGAQRKKRKLLEEARAVSIARDERMNSLTEALVGYLSNSQRSAGDIPTRTDATSAAGTTDTSSTLRVLADLTKQRSDLLSNGTSDDSVSAKTVELLTKQICILQTQISESLS